MDPETHNNRLHGWYMNPEPEEPEDSEDYRDSDYYKDLRLEDEKNKEV